MSLRRQVVRYGISLRWNVDIRTSTPLRACTRCFATVQSSSRSTSSSPRVAVIGAGPAGLVLARLLQRNKVSCTVFELDKDRTARTQGGSLDLHEGSAQRALKEAGLYERFLEHARHEGEVLKIYDPYDNVLLDESKDDSNGRPEEMHGRPEIDRVVLRNLLLDSLEPNSVRWAHRLVSVDQEESGKYRLQFAHGSELDFDLIVGADGTWSKVRHLLTDKIPYFSGVTGIDISISDPETRHPDLAQRVGKGMCLTLGQNKGILSQRNGDGAIRVYALMRAAESWHKESEIKFSDSAAAKATFIKANFGDWSQGARDLVLRSDSDVLPRPIYMLPVGLTWQHKPGATLVGDAAHVMSPFAGVGVNVAMEDALELALNINSKCVGNDTSAAVQAYEKDMFERAEKNAQASMMFLNLFFHERGGAAMMDHFAEMREQEQAAAAAATG